jgi:hypothetical protein
LKTRGRLIDQLRAEQQDLAEQLGEVYEQVASRDGS